MLEASDYEIGSIMGEYYASGRELKVGSEIQVSELYEAKREIVGQHKALTEKAESLARLIVALQKLGLEIGPIAQRIQEKELKKDS